MKSFKTFINEETAKSVKFKGNKVDGFKKYARGMGQLKEYAKELLGVTGPLKIEHIAELYAKYRIAPTDDIEYMFDTDDIYKYREYDRKMVDGWTGSRTAEEIAELEASIKKDGIKHYASINMDRDNSTGTVTVYLGEGNHRLSIARKLNIKKMPVKIWTR